MCRGGPGVQVPWASGPRRFRLLFTSSLIDGAASWAATAAITATPYNPVVAAVLAKRRTALLTTPALLTDDRRTAATAARIAPLVELLATLDLVDGFDRPSLEGLALAATPLSLGNGETLLRVGEPGLLRAGHRTATLSAHRLSRTSEPRTHVA